MTGNHLVNQTDGNGDRYYYFHNGHGDVVAVTDASGIVEKRYEYNAYGESYETDNGSGTGLRNPLKYFGQYFDEETGEYYLRARYYCPVSMRFVSEDTYTGVSGNPLSLNRYLYVSGNPVRYVDPTGHNEEAINYIEVAIDGVVYYGKEIASGVAMAFESASPFVIISGVTYILVESVDQLAEEHGVKSDTYVSPIYEDEFYVYTTDTESADYYFNNGECETPGTEKTEEELDVKVNPIDEGNGPVIYETPIFEFEHASEIVLFNQRENETTPTSQSQLQRQVEKGQAPRGVDRVDKPHVPGQQPHVHFGDGTSLNVDGTVHDAHKGVPDPSNKTKKWLLENGWQIGE